MSDIKQSQDFHSFSSQISLQNKFLKAVFGAKVLFNLKSMQNLTNNKKSYATVNPDIQKCQKTIKTCGITAMFLSGALALSLRRYMTNVYSKISPAMISWDLTILTAGFTFGVVYGLNTSSQILDIIRLNLIRQRNEKYLQFTKQFSQSYHISHKHMTRIISAKIIEADELLKIIEQKQAQPNKNK